MRWPRWRVATMILIAVALMALLFVLALEMSRPVTASGAIDRSIAYLRKSEPGFHSADYQASVDLLSPSDKIVEFPSARSPIITFPRKRDYWLVVFTKDSVGHHLVKVDRSTGRCDKWRGDGTD